MYCKLGSRIEGKRERGEEKGWWGRMGKRRREKEEEGGGGRERDRILHDVQIEGPLLPS